MKENTGYNFLDLVMCLSKALDLISANIVNHHKRVAYIAYMLSGELGMEPRDRATLVYAGALHDCGAFSLSSKLAALEFNFESEFEQAPRHAETGYRLLKRFAPFEEIAKLIRHHHTPWASGAGESADGVETLPGSHILHLADRIDVLFDINKEALEQSPAIIEKITSGANKKFNPLHIEAFKSLASKEFFWLDLRTGVYDPILSSEIKSCSATVDIDMLSGFVRILSNVVDFRSRFTATHSSGVAAVAETLGGLAGLPEQDRLNLRLAGFVHDLGKLAVPTEILEKTGKLTVQEFNIVKTHTYHTYRTLEHVCGLQEISAWAAYHHERLNGHGYPFHIGADGLDTGARIMAVADIFTAVTEDRPYRKALSDNTAVDILQSMAKESAIDPDITALLVKNIEEVTVIQRSAQVQELVEYKTIGLS